MGFAGSAFANITPILNSVTACGSGSGAGTCSSDDGGSYSGSGYAWTYTIDLDANQTIDPTSTTLGASTSSYGVIYDFGAVDGNIISTGDLLADFTISTSLTTPSPSGITPTDSASLLNIVYTAKVGTDLNGSPSGLTLGTITIISSSSGTANRFVNFIGQAISNVSGLSTGNLGSVEAPNLASPEPASIALLLAGLVGGFVVRRKRASQR